MMLNFDFRSSTRYYSDEKIQELLDKVSLGDWMPIRFRVLSTDLHYRALTHYSLEVTITVIDAVDNRGRIQVQHPMRMEPVGNEREFAQALRRVVQEVLVHEMDEFLVFAGIPVSNPHKRPVRTLLP